MRLVCLLVLPALPAQGPLMVHLPLVVVVSVLVPAPVVRFAVQEVYTVAAQVPPVALVVVQELVSHACMQVQYWLLWEPLCGCLLHYQCFFFTTVAGTQLLRFGELKQKTQTNEAQFYMQPFIGR